MKGKNCSEVMDGFLKLDRNERIPLWITKHLLICSECRTNVRLFTQAEKILSRRTGGENPFTYAALSDVKEKLYPGSTKEKKVPIFYWLAIGIVLVVCMILLALFAGKYFPELQSLGCIFAALVITTYCMLFIGMNMDFFVKQSSMRR